MGVAVISCKKNMKLCTIFYFDKNIFNEERKSILSNTPFFVCAIEQFSEKDLIIVTYLYFFCWLVSLVVNHQSSRQSPV